MKPKFYTVLDCGAGAGCLAVMPKPLGHEGLDAEIAGLAQQGIQQVVSLLEADEIETKGLTQEGMYCQRYGLEFTHLPLPDRQTPEDSTALILLIQDLHQRVLNNRRIVVHCWGGIGRSGLVAIGVLLRQGYSLPAAIAQASSARTCAMPHTSIQITWLQQYEKVVVSERKVGIALAQKPIQP